MDELLEITKPPRKKRRHSSEEEERENEMKSIGIVLTIVAMTSGIVAFYYTDKIKDRQEITEMVRAQENEYMNLRGQVNQIHGKIVELSEVSEQLQNAVVRIETVQDKIEERLSNSKTNQSMSPAIPAKGSK